MSELESSQGNKQLAPPSKEEKKHSSAGKALGIVGATILTLIVVVLLVNAMLSIFMPHYYPTYGGYRLFAVVTDSMEPTIPTGNMIVDKMPTSAAEIEVGTVITFEIKDANGNTIVNTHRVSRIETTSDGRTLYITRGDNVDNDDSIFPEYEDIIGVWTGKQCGVFGYFFGFMQSTGGAIVLFIALFFAIVIWINFAYIDRMEKRRKRENAALKKSEQALSGVNLRYDNIREITAVMDVLDMVTDETESISERKEIEKRLDAFIEADNIELPQTPETAAILDSLPAPDTPMSLASALRSGATLRQAEDGQTLILTGLSGGKSILLTPIQTPDGIILCQQGVRLRSDIAPNLESVGATSMPGYPEFFEGQPLKKNVEYPELPQPHSPTFGADMLSPHSSVVGSPEVAAAALSAPYPTGNSALVGITGAHTDEVPALGAGGDRQPANAAADTTPEPNNDTAPDPENYQAKVAYAQYREVAAQLELRQAEELQSLLNDVTPLSPDEQERIKAYRAAEKAAKAAQPKKPRKPKTEAEKAAAKERAEKRKEEQEAFLAALSPTDRELYLSEQKLSKSRAATIKRLKRLAADRKLLEKLSDGDAE